MWSLPTIVLKRTLQVQEPYKFKYDSGHLLSKIMNQWCQSFQVKPTDMSLTGLMNTATWLEQWAQGGGSLSRVSRNLRWALCHPRWWVLWWLPCPRSWRFQSRLDTHCCGLIVGFWSLVVGGRVKDESHDVKLPFKVKAKVVVIRIMTLQADLAFYSVDVTVFSWWPASFLGLFFIFFDLSELPSRTIYIYIVVNQGVWASGYLAT